MTRVLPGIKGLEHLNGYDLTPLYWHPENEDLVFVDCVQRPALSCYVFYLYLEDWSIE